MIYNAMCKETTQILIYMKNYTVLYTQLAHTSVTCTVASICTEPY